MTRRRSQLSRLAQRLASSPRELTACFLTVYLLASLWRSVVPLWYDELFAWHLGKLPSAAVIWQAFRDGTDFNVPIYIWASHYAMALFGDSPVATRLPMILAFACACLLMREVVGRRWGPNWGVTAMVLLASAATYDIAIQARPYGIAYALTTLAILCWQRCGESGALRWKLAFSVSQASAILAQSFCLFALIPLGIGELARIWQRRRVDWAMCLCLALPALAILPSLAVSSRVAQLHLATPFDVPGIGSFGETYTELLGPAMPLLSIPLLIAIRLRRSKSTSLGLPTHELVCALAFALYPLFSLVASLSQTGRYFPKYGFAAIFGIIPLLIALMAGRLRHRRLAGGLVAAIVVALFTMQQVFYFGRLAFNAPPQIRQASGLTLAGRGVAPVTPEVLPLAISNANDFLEFTTYAPDDIARQLVYVTDHSSALGYTGSEEYEYILPKLDRWLSFRSPITPYERFVRETPRFYVFGAYRSREDWLLRKLAADGAVVRLLSVYERGERANILAEVEMKNPAKMSVR